MNQRQLVFLTVSVLGTSVIRQKSDQHFNPECTSSRERRIKVDSSFRAAGQSPVSTCQLTARENSPRMLDPKEVGEVAVVFAIMDHEVGKFSRFQ